MSERGTHLVEEPRGVHEPFAIERHDVAIDDAGITGCIGDLGVLLLSFCFVLCMRVCVSHS